MSNKRSEIELERTELASPAVSGYTEEGAGDISSGTLTTKAKPSPLAFPSFQTAKPLPSTSQQTDEGCYVHTWTSNRGHEGLTRIAGFGKLKNLLHPAHPFFEDKYAQIKYWTRYFDRKSGFDIVYPRVRAMRGNPFRLHQLNSQCAARAAKLIFSLVENRDLAGFRVTDISKTLPAAVSLFLASKGKLGVGMVWNLNDRFWRELVARGLIGEGSARRSNLHTWKTELPLKPHFHFHELVPNYEQVGREVVVEDMSKCPCPRCGKTSWLHDSYGYMCATCNPGQTQPESIILKKRDWQRQRLGTMVPWSDKELMLVKAIWLDLVINIVRKYDIAGAWDCQEKLLRFQRRYGLTGLVRLISFLSRFKKGLIDVNVSFIKFGTDIAKAQFMHKLAYNGRNPLEDFCVYSNHSPDCDMPPEFILHYSNKSRLYGWWRDIKRITGKLSVEKEKEKLSPYSAEPMEYLGRYASEDLLNCHDGRLVAVDFIRGRPVERLLGAEDKEWLKSVDLQSWLHECGICC